MGLSSEARAARRRPLELGPKKYLEDQLTQRFKELGIGQAGLARDGRTVTSAHDVVTSWKTTRKPKEGEMTNVQALGGLLEAYAIGITDAVAIAAMWGECYGSGVEDPFMSTPLSVKKHDRGNPTPSVPDFEMEVRRRVR